MNSYSIEILFRSDCTYCHPKGTGPESHRFPSPFFCVSGFSFRFYEEIQSDQLAEKSVSVKPQPQWGASSDFRAQGSGAGAGPVGFPEAS